MASFVEEAVLRVTDKASKTIDEINRELKDLFRKQSKTGGLDIKIRPIIQGFRFADGVNIVRLRGVLTSLSKTAVEPLRIRATAQSLTYAGVLNVRAQIRPTTQNALRMPVRATSISTLSGVKLRVPVIASSIRRPPNSNPVRIAVQISRVVPGPTVPDLDTRAKILSFTVASSAQPVDVIARVRRWAGPTPPVPPPPGGNPPPGPSSSGQGYIGATLARIARVPGYAIGGELYFAARQTAVAATSAPISMDDALGRARLAGFEEELVESLKQAAIEFSTGQYQGVSAADILNASIEAAGSTDDFDTILANMELIARASVIAGVSMKDMAAGAEQGRLAFKAAQIAGFADNPEQADRIIDAALRAQVASGGDLLIAEVVRQMQQLGSTFVTQLSDQALLELSLIRDEGGRMSTAEARIAFQDLTRSNVAKYMMERQIEAGLRGEDGRAIFGDEFAASPLEFTSNVLMPLMEPYLEELGGTFNDPEAVQNALTEMGFGTQPSRFFTAAIANLEQRQKELEKGQRVNLDSPFQEPTTRQLGASVAAQFENFMEQALAPALPGINASLQQLTDAFAKGAEEGTSLSQTFAENTGEFIEVSTAAILEGLADPETRAMAGAAAMLTVAAGTLLTAGRLLSAGAGGGPGGGPNGNRQGNRLISLLFGAAIADGIMREDFGTTLAEELRPLLGRFSDVAGEALAGTLQEISINEDGEARSLTGMLAFLLKEGLKGPFNEKYQFPAVSQEHLEQIREERAEISRLRQNEIMFSQLFALLQDIGEAKDVRDFREEEGIPIPSYVDSSIKDMQNEFDQLVARLESSGADTLLFLLAASEEGASFESVMAAMNDQTLSTFETSAAQMDATFNQGSDTLNTIGPVIDQSAANFPNIAGPGLASYGTEFGQAAGAAIQAAASRININVRAPTSVPAAPPVDTGSTGVQ